MGDRLANGKGGCARATGSPTFGVRAASSGSNVAMLDYDPQQSLARWWEHRGHELLDPQLIKTGDAAGVADVPRLKSLELI